MEDKYFEEALRNWNNGNLSELDKVELIAIARYFEELYKEAIKKR